MDYLTGPIGLRPKCPRGQGVESLFKVTVNISCSSVSHTTTKSSGMTTKRLKTTTKRSKTTTKRCKTTAKRHKLIAIVSFYSVQNDYKLFYFL